MDNMFKKQTHIRQVKPNMSWCYCSMHFPLQPTCLTYDFNNLFYSNVTLPYRIIASLTDFIFSYFTIPYLALIAKLNLSYPILT